MRAKLPATISLGLAAFLLSGTLVLAQEPTDSAPSPTPTVEPTATPTVAPTSTPTPTISLKGKRPVITPGAGRDTACQLREVNVKRRSQNMVRLSENMFTRFTNISTRVQNFYTNKIVAKGGSVADYDALVADVAAKKTVVQTALDKASTDANSFSCTTDVKPKDQLATFRTDLKGVLTAMKDYRKAVRNLIVGVHSAAGDDTESEGTGGPKSTKVKGQDKKATITPGAKGQGAAKLGTTEGGSE